MMILMKRKKHKGNDVAHHHCNASFFSFFPPLICQTVRTAKKKISWPRVCVCMADCF